MTEMRREFGGDPAQQVQKLEKNIKSAPDNWNKKQESLQQIQEIKQAVQDRSI